MITCAVDTDIISKFISAVVGKDKWKVKRIINNTTFAEIAICIVNYKDYWVRIEYRNKDSGKIFLYNMNQLGFIDYDLSLDFSSNNEVIEFCNSLL